MEVTLAVQKAMRDKLVAGAFQTAAGVAVAVYDQVPPAPAFPYVTIGESQLLAPDSPGDGGDDVHVTLHVWSRAPGKVEAKRIGGALRNALAPKIGAAFPLDLAALGHRVVTWTFDSFHPMADVDGLTTHGVFSATYSTAPL